MKLVFSLRGVFVVALAVLLAGCARTPSARFYTLTPLGRQGAQQLFPKSVNQVSVRILPVQIPDYLERPQIVTLDDQNVLKLAEFNRWAGSLSDNITAVVAENLGLLLGSDRVFVQAVSGAEKADYSVAVQIVRLDCLPGDQVILKARWAVSPYQGKEAASIHASTYTQRLSDTRYDTLAAGISHVLGVLSSEIAQEITEQLKSIKSKRTNNR